MGVNAEIGVNAKIGVNVKTMVRWGPPSPDGGDPHLEIPIPCPLRHRSAPPSTGACSDTVAVSASVAFASLNHEP